MISPELPEQDASLRFLPSLGLTLHRRCARCFERDCTIVPNPEGRARCPRCDAPMPPPEDRDPESVAFRAPLLARLCFWVSDRLIEFHDYLKELRRNG